MTISTLNDFNVIMGLLTPMSLSALSPQIGYKIFPVHARFVSVIQDTVCGRSTDSGR